MMSKLCKELLLRILFLISYVCLKKLPVYERKILSHEIVLYKYPKTESFVSTTAVCVIAAVVPMIVVLIYYCINKDGTDVREAFLSLSLTTGVVFIICGLLKLITGKPRPDFYWRCFPNGMMTYEVICNGNAADIKDGRQSFPSGHSAIMFSNFGFISLYLMGKFHVYEKAGSGESWRVFLCLCPIICAMCVGASRYSDYHHDGIDIFAGVMIGTVIIIICYHFYYPPFYNPSCDISYASQNNNKTK